jgi:type II secretory pathway pseudopilin PulG
VSAEPRCSIMVRLRPPSGYSLVEVVFVTALMATLSAIAIPELHAGLDDYRAAGSVRYLTTRFARARMEAVARSRDVAVRFTQDAHGWSYAVYVDGNGDGVRTRDILRGTDTELVPPERLSANFPGVTFAVPAGLPPVESGPPTDGDPLKLGSSNLLSFSAHGTSSSGSVYVRGRNGSQYVIRAFGETGKVRALKFDARTQRWNPL